MAKKKTTPNKRPEYTLKKKLAVLKILQENDLNYATRRQTDVAINTLKRWQDRYGTELDKEENVTVIAAEVIKDVAERNALLNDRIYKLKVIIVERIKEILPNVTNLDSLQRTLKTLCEIDGTMKDKEEAPGPKVTNYYNLFETLNQQLIDESKKSS